MDHKRWSQAKALFDRANRLPEQQRAEFLESMCASDPALRAEVEALLRADERLDSAAFGSATVTRSLQRSAAPTLIGQQIGRYRVVGQLGEGGFGRVYAAEQSEPVRRRVALKVIKPGMDSRAVVARFEAERQALAVMEHPNIAAVFDGGLTDDGYPYFVMELVRGDPITEFCDKNRLMIDQRAELMVEVCSAIQHAHAKGVIHRDLKPSNVLVTYDAEGHPRPKIIDFGVAKAINQRLSEQTLYTERGQMVGTPEYMSPEQAEMSGVDIDTRSDVYSLGVLLYELMTGVLPFDQATLRAAAFGEIQRMIREDEPPKPSTRLNTCLSNRDDPDTGSRIAQARRADARTLTSVLRRDLDWVIMKCLEKDRERRYETASALAADIRRHLDDEPVVAGPPSTRYRMQKFIRRNRAAVIAGSAIAAVLLLGVVGTTSGMVWAVDQKSRAERAEGTAQLELARATEIKRLISEMLSSIDPVEAQGADTTLVRGILDDTATRLEADEISDEQIAAELHALVGDVYSRIGLLEDAEHHLAAALRIMRRTLGEEHPDTLRTMARLGDVYSDQDRVEESVQHLERALELQRRTIGASHPDTLTTTVDLAFTLERRGQLDHAIQLYLEALEKQSRTLGASDRQTLRTMRLLAATYRIQGQYDQAMNFASKAVRIARDTYGDADWDTQRMMTTLGAIHFRAGRLEDASRLLSTSLETQTRFAGERHPRTLHTMHILGLVEWKRGRLLNAETITTRAYELQREVLGEKHQTTVSTLGNLGLVYLDLGRLEDSLEITTEALKLFERISNVDHPNGLIARQNLGNLHRRMGQYAEAERLLSDVFRDEKQALGADHPFTRLAKHSLAAVYMETDRLPKGLPMLEDVCHDERAADGTNLWRYLPTLAQARFRTGDVSGAVDAQAEALECLPDGHAFSDRYTATLAEYLTMLTTIAFP